jgi:hypothetical protein
LIPFGEGEKIMRSSTRYYLIGTAIMVLVGVILLVPLSQPGIVVPHDLDRLVEEVSEGYVPPAQFRGVCVSTTDHTDADLENILAVTGSDGLVECERRVNGFQMLALWGALTALFSWSAVWVARRHAKSRHKVVVDNLRLEAAFVGMLVLGVALGVNFWETLRDMASTPAVSQPFTRGLVVGFLWLMVLYLVRKDEANKRQTKEPTPSSASEVTDAKATRGGEFSTEPQVTGR